jgi:quercetin dioxygenase-like cupin family protein
MRLNRASWFVLFVFVFAISVIGRSAYAAEEICKVAKPGQCKIVLENDKVRVIEFTSKAGEKVPMHSHPNHIVYLLSDSQVRYTMPDGSTKDSMGKKGEARWVEAGDHASENIGKTDTHVLIIELKGSM